MAAAGEGNQVGVAHRLAWAWLAIRAQNLRRIGNFCQLPCAIRRCSR
jgi:hypothetical protein